MLHITITAHSLTCALQLLCSHGVAVRATKYVQGTYYIEVQVHEASCFLQLPVTRFLGEVSFQSGTLDYVLMVTYTAFRGFLNHKNSPGGLQATKCSFLFSCCAQIKPPEYSRSRGKLIAAEP